MPDKKKAKMYYDYEAKDYIQMYEDGYEGYPANLIRLNFIVKCLKQNNIVTILDAGCGTCGPMIRLLKEGFKVEGFDFSEEMIEQGKKELKKAGYNPDLIFQADLEDDCALPDKKYDAAISLGIFPHIINEQVALTNIRKRLNENGLVFIEFRNDLFAAFTLNKYSLDFFLRVIDINSLPAEVSEGVVRFYSDRLKIDKPERKGGKMLYSDISTEFHNPLTIEDVLFDPCGFSVVRKHFYHYHALPPIFEEKYPKVFRELSLKMENPGDWRGHLMASAFVVEARKR